MALAYPDVFSYRRCVREVIYVERDLRRPCRWICLKGISDVRMMIITRAGYVGALTQHQANSFAHAFIASWAVIIVSEIGDKTFFIAAIMAMRYDHTLSQALA